MPGRSVLSQLQAHRDGSSQAVARPAGVDDTPAVGSYARISDAYEGRETGVTEDGVNRQLKANRHIAAARHWRVAREYVDNDVSAFKANVVRDAFEELLEDLAAGDIDGIVCYNLDRFARQVTDLERAVKIYDDARRAKLQLHFATAEGDLNLASDDGLTMARVMVAFANKASRDTARRVAMKQQEQRDDGVARYGRRPFGIQLDTLGRWVLNDIEAAAIRRAADALTAGEMSWVSVTRSWNEQGLSTALGNEWVPTSVKSVLRSPRLAGWLMHRGKIAVHSRTGQLVRADIPAVLTDEQFEALLVATEATRTTRQTGYDGRRRYLLSGILRCAECGAKMAGHKLKRGDKTYRYYVCRANDRAGDGYSGGCGRVSFSATTLDELVTELVLPRLIQDSGGLVVETEKPYVSEMHDLKTEKDQLLAAFKIEGLTSELVFPRVTRVEQEINRLRRLQSEWVRDQKVASRSIAVSPETWDSMSLEERSGHIENYIEAIYVSGSVTRHGRRSDLSRVSAPVWRAPSAGGGSAPVAQ